MPTRVDYNYTDDIPAQPGELNATPRWMRDAAAANRFRQSQQNKWAIMRLRGGARTITQGGWSDLADEQFREMGPVKRHIKDQWHPRSLLKAPTQLELDPRQKGLFLPNIFFQEGRPGETMAQQGRTRIGSWMERNSNEGGVLDKLGLIQRGEPILGPAGPEGGIINTAHLQHAFDPKMLSRFSAAADYAKLGTSELNGAQMTAFEGFLNRSGNEVMRDALSSTGPVTGDTASQATRMSGQAAFTGYGGGLLQGAGWGTVDKAILDAASPMARAGFERGISAAGTRAAFSEGGWSAAFEHVAERQVGKEAVGEISGWAAKKAAGTVVGDLAIAFAGKVGASAAMGFANPIMDAITVYEGVKLAAMVAKLGLDATGAAIKSVGKSFNGQIYKDPMGMGYKDTAAAATSRARGTLAIQNSRLNMRSILGSEAGMVHAHFG